MVKITINDKVTKLKEKSKAKNTQEKYKGDWLKFIDYCKNKYHCNPLDVDDLDSAYALTANYMHWLHEDPEAKILKGSSNIPGREKINNNPYSSTAYKASTIQRILASISYKYRLNNFQFDRKNPNIAETISAIVRDEKNLKSSQAKDILKADIEKIIDSIPNNSEDFRNIRDKALILYHLNRYEEALNSIELSVNFNNKDYIALNTMGIIQLGLLNLEIAKEIYRLILSLGLDLRIVMNNNIGHNLLKT